MKKNKIEYEAIILQYDSQFLIDWDNLELKMQIGSGNYQFLKIRSFVSNVAF
jgi:hypothetical protein